MEGEHRDRISLKLALVVLFFLATLTTLPVTKAQNCPGFPLSPEWQQCFDQFMGNMRKKTYDSVNKAGVRAIAGGSSSSSSTSSGSSGTNTVSMTVGKSQWTVKTQGISLSSSVDNGSVVIQARVGSPDSTNTKFLNDEEMKIDLTYSGGGGKSKKTTKKWITIQVTGGSPKVSEIKISRKGTSRVSSTLRLRHMKNREADEGWNFIQVSPQEVQLKMVLGSGQSFRWKNHPDLSSEWTGVFSHRLWTLRQSNSDLDQDKVFYKIHNGNSNDSAVEALLRDYLQLDVSLTALYKDWRSRDPKFASLTQKDYQGIRILKQDPIETIFAFICSANNNISRISSMVNKLCLFYGEELCVLDGSSHFDFPSVEALAGEGVEVKLRKEGFGYRAGYIAKSAQQILQRGGAKWVQDLETMDYESARKELQTLHGVGRKVADCICLMALGHNSAIPVDTHIHALGKEYIPHLGKVKTLTDKVYSEITSHFQELHGDYAGWAQSVLFASRLRHLKNDKSECGKEEPKTKKSRVK